MTLIGSNDFRGGETRKKRISGAGAVLDRCNGFKNTDGALIPENVPSKVNITGDALSGTTPEQSPCVFVSGTTHTVVARDANAALRTCVQGGSWAAASDVVDILAGSNPARVGRQLFFPTDGHDAKIVAYEPGSSSTKTRPASFRSPNDYKDDEKPTTTESTYTPVYLFDSSDTWTAVSARCVVAASGGVSTFTLNTSTPAASQIAYADVTSVTPSATGAAYLMIDIYSSDDPQNYTDQYGLFANDGAQLPSGLTLTLHSAVTGGGTTLATLRIPRLPNSGKVHRVVLKLASISTAVLSVALNTDSFYTPITDASVTYTLKFYTDTYTDNWLYRGNVLLPALVVNSKSPYADQMNHTETSVRTTITATNLLTNGGFETAGGSPTAAASWTATGGPTRYDKASRSGSYCMKMDEDGESIVQGTSTSGIAVTAGAKYGIECWARGYENNCDFRISIAEYTSGNALIGTTTYPTTGGVSGGYWRAYDSSEWQQYAGEHTASATADHITFTVITLNGDGATQDMFLDDVAFYAVDTVAAGSAWIFFSCTESKTKYDPAIAREQYCYCLVGRDLLGTDDVHLMVSNPSDPDTSDGAELVFDPWRSVTVAVALPTYGQIQTVVLNAAGTGYTVGDVLTISDGAAGIHGTATVATITGGGGTGPVATFTFTTATGGYFYTTTTGCSVTGGTGSNCTVDITAATAITDYGSYLTHIAIYRRTFTGLEGQEDTGVWGAWEFIDAPAIATSMSYLDEGNDSDPYISYSGVDYDLPDEVEITNDFARSARYVAYMGGRVFGGCLDWDEDTSAWKLPTAIEISGYQKPWAFPTTNDASSLVTDGTQLDGYAVSGNEIRGMLARQDELFVFLDNEFFKVTGTDPLSGYTITRLDSIGCTSARTLADCRKAIIWHDGNDFYGWMGGLSVPISRRDGISLIDSTIIDFTKPHQAVHWNDQYIFYCYLTRGSILTAAVQAAGTGYKVGDVLQVTGGSGTCGTVTVATITGGGSTGPVGTVTVTKAGYDYVATTGAATYDTTTTAATGCTVTITTGEYALLIYDLDTGSWRTRRSTALNYVGLCTDGDDVFGVSTGGNAWNVFGSSTTEGIDGASPTTQSPTRQVATEFIYVRPDTPDLDYHISRIVVDAESPASQTLYLEFEAHGNAKQSAGWSSTLELPLTTACTKYSEGIDLVGNAIKVRAYYTGTTPPTIHGIFLEVDENPVI